MRVLVLDTSVIVDLERGGLLEAVFALSLELAVPDLLYRRELEEYRGNRLVELGLRVEELDEDGVKLALNYRQRASKLSLPDTFALALAKSAGFVLLTGDALLRELATAEKVECHGVLWVMDQMFSEGVVQPQHLHTGLSAIARHPRCRLPKDEIASRLALFERLQK
jgi:predicted nucleic acid-binding protein